MTTAISDKVLGTLAFIIAAAVSNFYDTRDRAFARARALTDSRGIANLGCGTGHYKSKSSMVYATDPLVKANVDSTYDIEIPNFYCLDMEKPTGFTDQQFSVVFSSHCLEHLENWKGALSDWLRIADKVIVVLPHPLSAGQFLDPTHKRYVSFGWIQEIRNFDENIEVYY